METIDMTPTPMEYVSIASRLRSQILADIRRSRLQDDIQILRSLLEIAIYIGAQSNAQELKDVVLNPLK
jgi:hypothetical protein